MSTPFEVALIGLLTVSPIHRAAPAPGAGSELIAANHFRKEPLSEDAEYGGDAHNLPVGCAYDPERLVDWARHQMPDVQAAIREFERRGYVAVPAADTAVSGCQRGIPASGVTLAFMKPGAFIDSAHVVAPTILVLTRITPTGVATQVSGGIVVADGAASKMYSGDSLSMFRYTDPSFDIRNTSFGGGGGGPRKEPVGPEGWWDPVIDPESRFNRFLRCTGYGAIGCVVTTVIAGGPGATAVKLAAIMGAPEYGLAILGGCTLGTAIGCLIVF